MDNDRNDRILYTNMNGEMLKLAEPTTDPNRGNFLIVCEYGDWSGFRTLAECERQFQRDCVSNRREDRFYRIVERL